jgi:hypothetical protein
MKGLNRLLAIIILTMFFLVGMATAEKDFG